MITFLYRHLFFLRGLFDVDCVYFCGFILQNIIYSCFFHLVSFLSCRSKVTSRTDLCVCSRFDGTMLYMGWSPWDTIWSTRYYMLLSLFYTSGTFYILSCNKYVYSHAQLDRFTLTKAHLYTFQLSHHGAW